MKEIINSLNGFFLFNCSNIKFLRFGSKVWIPNVLLLFTLEGYIFLKKEYIIKIRFNLNLFGETSINPKIGFWGVTHDEQYNQGFWGCFGGNNTDFFNKNWLRHFFFLGFQGFYLRGLWGPSISFSFLLWSLSFRNLSFRFGSCNSLLRSRAWGLNCFQNI